MRKVEAIFHEGHEYNVLVFTKELEAVDIYAPDGEGFTDPKDVLVCVSDEGRCTLVSAAVFLRSMTLEELSQCEWHVVDDTVVFWLMVGTQAEEVADRVEANFGHAVSSSKSVDPLCAFDSGLGYVPPLDQLDDFFRQSREDLLRRNSLWQSAEPGRTLEDDFEDVDSTSQSDEGDCESGDDDLEEADSPV